MSVRQHDRPDRIEHVARPQVVGGRASTEVIHDAPHRVQRSLYCAFDPGRRPRHIVAGDEHAALFGGRIGLHEVRVHALVVAVVDIARRAGLAIVYGYPERSAEGAIFNAAQCIGADGVHIAHYRKTHLFGELDRTLFSASREPLTTFDFNGVRIGLLICYDLEFPETARALALAGADLIVVPTANMVAYDFVATTLVPARAYENQVYVAYANHCGREGDITYGGLSSIVAADGSVLARAERDEALLIADIDRARLIKSRSRFPYLADRRPGMYGSLLT